jgi:outer membrane protein OmpA-like peptidoglycan-associated protein
MKFSSTVLFMLFLFCNSVLSQQAAGRKFNAYSGTLVFTAEGGLTFGYTDYKGFEQDYLGKASLEYFFPTNGSGSFGLKVFSGTGFLSGRDSRWALNYFRTKFHYVGGGGTFALSIDDAVFPYSSVGVSYLWFRPKVMDDRNPSNVLAGDYKGNEVNVYGELGVRIMLANNLSFNLNGGVLVSPNDNLDNMTVGGKTDLIFLGAAGFSFSFFTKEDSDGDGIDDGKDICPNTPNGIQVDDFGCPLDDDFDGIPNFLDKCSGTLRNVKVDNFGCPLNSDGDNVPDYLDLCTNTPSGIVVDEFGCPIDGDADGVADYLDECPGTEADIPVDKKGCPLDSDLDGVPDYIDLCPETKPDEKVDQNGCVAVVEVKQMILSAGANFAYGKTELLPSAFAELNKMVEVMKQDPKSLWRIEGHTDGKGSIEVNKKISQQRAQSVYNYFVSKGIDGKRLQVVGMGKEFPIADNSTEEGRAENRRVVIIRID